MPKEEFYAGVILLILALAIILYDYFRPTSRSKKIEQIGGALGETQEQQPPQNSGRRPKLKNRQNSLFHRARRLANQGKQLRRQQKFQKNKKCCPCVGRERFRKRNQNNSDAQAYDQVQPYDQDQSQYQPEDQMPDQSQEDDQMPDQPDEQMDEQTQDQTEDQDQPYDQTQDQSYDQTQDQPYDETQDQTDDQMEEQGWNDVEEQVGGGGYSYLNRNGKKMNRLFRNNWTWPTISSNWMNGFC